MFLLHRIGYGFREWLGLGYGKAPKTKRKLQFFLVLVLFILFLFSLCFYAGRPKEPRYFEVDVTDKIADFPQKASAGSQNLSYIVPDSPNNRMSSPLGQAAAEGLLL